MSDPTFPSERVKQAEQIARAAHDRQVDKLGVDYIEHVRAVSQAVAHLGEDYEIVGLLHDSIEDCDDRSIVSPEMLRDRFGASVAQAVDAITKRPGEDYLNTYLPRVMANPLSAAVKRADVAHNRGRLHLLDAETRARLEKKYALFDVIASQ